MFLDVTYLSQASASDKQNLRQLNDILIDRLVALEKELLATDEASAINDKDLLVDHITGHLQVALDSAYRLQYYLKHHGGQS